MNPYLGRPEVPTSQVQPTFLHGSPSHSHLQTRDTLSGLVRVDSGGSLLAHGHLLRCKIQPVEDIDVPAPPDCENMALLHLTYPLAPHHMSPLTQTGSHHELMSFSAARMYVHENECESPILIITIIFSSV